MFDDSRAASGPIGFLKVSKAAMLQPPAWHVASDSCVKNLLIHAPEQVNENHTAQQMLGAEALALRHLGAKLQTLVPAVLCQTALPPPMQGAT